MDFDTSIAFSNCLSEIQRETGGHFFVNIEEKSAVGGVIVTGCEYNDRKVYSAINKFKKKWKVEFNHLMIGENIILLQFYREE
ncbi:MAG: hypothetical protein ACRCX2_01620 [Paraclostridium sp.]